MRLLDYLHNKITRRTKAKPDDDAPRITIRDGHIVDPEHECEHHHHERSRASLFNRLISSGACGWSPSNKHSPRRPNCGCGRLSQRHDASGTAYCRPCFRLHDTARRDRERECALAFAAGKREREQKAVMLRNQRLERRRLAREQAQA